MIRKGVQQLFRWTNVLRARTLNWDPSTTKRSRTKNARVSFEPRSMRLVITNMVWQKIPSHETLCAAAKRFSKAHYIFSCVQYLRRLYANIRCSMLAKQMFLALRKCFENYDMDGSQAQSRTQTRDTYNIVIAPSDKWLGFAFCIPGQKTRSHSQMDSMRFIHASRKVLKK